MNRILIALALAATLGQAASGADNTTTDRTHRCFPLQEIVAAFKYFESQKHFGKVCLEL